ncbi:hypothetical protein T631_2732 [Acinetobacter baumannii MRSN 3942]|nr:hypothetical protein T632_2657 [Acinetobacter baumannii MRSN 4106]KLT96524.1 hypothetical protein T631_2732 [Acinetobacter baumannii MRSN 3942]KLT97237.1 hypothetical protein T629_2798 [Acinetobacter baumannii MRSN 3405]
MQRSGTAFAASFYLKLQRIKPLCWSSPDESPNDFGKNH